jgi:MFS family permease
MLRAMMLSIVVVTSIDVLVAYLPVYGQQHGISVGLVGLLLSVRAAAGLVSRSMMARLLRALGRQVLLAGGLSLAGAGMLLLALAPDPWLLVVAMALFGMGTGVGQPITIAWVADQSPRSERATAIGIRLMGNRVALLTVPLLMGLIAGSAGIAITFVAVAMVLSAGAATAAVTPLGAPVERPSVGA